MADKKKPSYTPEQLLDQGPDDDAYAPPASGSLADMQRHLQEWARNRNAAMTPEQVRDNFIKMLSPKEQFEVLEYDREMAGIEPSPWSADEPMPKPRKKLERKMLTKRPAAEVDDEPDPRPRRQRSALDEDSDFMQWARTPDRRYRY